MQVRCIVQTVCLCWLRVVFELSAHAKTKNIYTHLCFGLVASHACILYFMQWPYEHFAASSKMSLWGGRNKRIQQSRVCLWVETVNTSNMGVYKDRIKRKGQTTGVFDAVRRRKPKRSGEWRRMISVFSVRQDWLSFKHCQLHLPLVTSQQSGDRKVRRSTQHHQHDGGPERNTTAAGSALLPRWFTRAANHDLRLPHRPPPPPPRLFLIQPVC